MIEVSESDNMIVTGDERPGHRMLTDDVIDLCNFSSTSMLEDAVRPKRDMDAEKSAETEIESDAVHPKCDGEAAAVDEDAANKQEQKANDGAARKILEENDEVTNEYVEIRRLIEERRNTARGDKQHLKEVSKQIRETRKGKKDKKRFKEYSKNPKESRTYPALNQRGRECLFQNDKGETITSRKGLQMSSANSTVNYMQAMKLKKRLKIPWVKATVKKYP